MNAFILKKVTIINKVTALIMINNIMFLGLIVLLLYHCNVFLFFTCPVEPVTLCRDNTQLFKLKKLLHYIKYPNAVMKSNAKYES